MISFTNRGSFKNAERFLKKNENISLNRYLKEIGIRGVEALAAATPKDTGLTADSWGYKIEKDDKSTTITWTNSNVVDGWYNVALMIQYGHGTASGVYVEGIDYINPALKSVFKDMADEVWEEVTSV